jgi:predicted transcriptional regulator
MVLALLPPKEGELARELLQSHSIRVNVESARRRQPSFVASTRKRMRARGSMEKRHGSACISKGKHAFPTM